MLPHLHGAKERAHAVNDDESEAGLVLQEALQRLRVKLVVA